MSCLFQDMTKHFRIGVGCLKLSAKRRAISSNTLCFSYGLLPHIHETGLMPPVTSFFPLVIRLLFFPFPNYILYSDELLVFLCLICSVFQEHHRELTFCASSFYLYLHFVFIHLSLHRPMQIDLLCASLYYMYLVNKTQSQRSWTLYSSGGSQGGNKQIDKHTRATWLRAMKENNTGYKGWQGGGDGVFQEGLA